MDYSKPAVIISNHQSFLDILVTVMQNPKIILLTNKWVYNSPFFGKVVQLGDYYPVMEGAEPAIDKLETKVKEDYSIVVFPEGTRSPDGRIRRFHKGAFYLAEKLQLDIVPLLLHGTADCMRKGDFMLFNSQMTMKYLPRITPEDTRFGVGYAERTKNIARYFKSEFEKLREQIETTTFFRQRLIMNYIYKGPYLEYYTRFKLRREKCYQALHTLLPREACITILGCGYGFMNYLLYFTGKNRIITGIDDDEIKIEIANNCYSKNGNLHFFKADVLEYSPEKSDAFVINEIGQYDEVQTKLLLKNLTGQLNPGGSVIVVQQGKDVASVERFKRGAELLKLEFSAVRKNEHSGSPLYIIRQSV